MNSWAWPLPPFTSTHIYYVIRTYTHITAFTLFMADCWLMTNDSWLVSLIVRVWFVKLTYIIDVLAGWWLWWLEVIWLQQVFNLHDIHSNIDWWIQMVLSSGLANNNHSITYLLRPARGPAIRPYTQAIKMVSALSDTINGTVCTGWLIRHRRIHLDLYKS